VYCGRVALGPDGTGTWAGTANLDAEAELRDGVCVAGTAG